MKNIFVKSILALAFLLPGAAAFSQTAYTGGKALTWTRGIGEILPTMRTPSQCDYQLQERCKREAEEVAIANCGGAGNGCMSDRTQSLVIHNDAISPEQGAQWGIEARNANGFWTVGCVCTAVAYRYRRM